MADKTAVATIQCTMIFGQHVFIQSTTITLKFLLTLLNHYPANVENMVSS